MLYIHSMHLKELAAKKAAAAELVAAEKAAAELVAAEKVAEAEAQQLRNTNGWKMSEGYVLTKMEA